MSTTKLRVLAHGDASVPNFERLEQGVNCFLGRDYTETAPGQFAFVPNNKVEEVPSRAEYLKALRDGDLMPADAATAAVAGVKFDEPATAPHGGE